MIDRVSQEVEIAYGRDASEAFYTRHLGKQQFLPNGNILISESQAGRVLEATPDRDVVWAFVNRWDERRTAWLVEGQRLPSDYTWLGTSDHATETGSSQHRGDR